MSILSSLISGTNFAQFADFASPAFFKVMPMRKLIAQGAELVAAYRDKAGWLAVVDERRAALERSGIRVKLASDGGAGEPLTSASADAKAHGETVLALYFHQLANPTATLLDLSAKRFCVRDGELVWIPGPGHMRWDPGFRSAMANVYATYYGGGGEEDLRAALDPLGLAEATDLFIAQFGGDAQRAVTFESAAFVSSFHAIFVRCKERGLTLHPNFLALGLYLATLYTTLEELAVPLDVRAAFAASGAARASADA